MAQTVRLNRNEGKKIIGGNDNNKIWTYAIVVALLVLIILLILLFTSRKSGESKVKTLQGIEGGITSIDYTDGQYSPQTAISQNYSITAPPTVSTTEAQSNKQTVSESGDNINTDNANVTDAKTASATQATSDVANESSKQPSNQNAVQKADDNTDDNGSSTLNLGYAKYEGKISKGVPHGRGKLTFNTSHVIDSYDPEHRMAAAGDVVTGMFYDGHLTQGKIVRADGTTERIMIGN